MFLQHPSRNPLHVDRLRNGEEVCLREAVDGAIVNFRVVLGGGDETIALVEVWHFLFLSLSWLGGHGVVRAGVGEVGINDRGGREHLGNGGIDRLLDLVSIGGRAGTRRGGLLLLHALRGREHGRVDLRVEVVERLLRSRVEPGQRQLDRLLLVAKDGERLAHLLQAAGRDDIVQAALLEAEADRFRPLDEVLRELLVLLAVRLHLADDDARFDGLVRVVLLKPVREAVKESLVHAARPDKAVRLALALRVRGGDHIEPLHGLDEHPDLLDVDALALKDGLKAHHALRPEVDLVKQQDRTPLHSLNDPAEHELRLAVDEPEAADEIVLVRFGGDVDADALTTGGGANLLHHRGLAVAAHARDVDGGELLGLEDGADVIVVTPRNESVVLDGDERNIGGRGDEVESVAVHVAHGITSFGDCQLHGGVFIRVFFDDGVNQHDHLRNAVLAALNAAALVLRQPSREDAVGLPSESVGLRDCGNALLTGVGCLTDGGGVAVQDVQGVEEVTLANVDAAHTPILPPNLLYVKHPHRKFCK